MNEEVREADIYEKGPANKIINNIESSICLVGMFGMTVVIFIHVIFRYVFNSPLQWSEEVSRFLTIWVTFGGSSYAFRKGAHVGVTAIVEAMPAHLKRVINIISKIMVILFFIIIGYYGAVLTFEQAGKQSIAANVPLCIPFSAIPLGSCLVLIRLLQDFIQDLKLAASRPPAKGGTP